MRWKHFLLNTIAGSDLLHHYQRQWIYRLLGAGLGHKVYIASRCLFTHTDLKNFSIGPYSFINHQCLIESGGGIKIGRNVSVGPRVSIVTTTHEINRGEGGRAGTPVRKKVTIEDYCWIGEGVRIHPGVTIGRGCVIGMGAVVIRDCEPNGIYAGVPAKLISSVPDPVPIRG